MNSLGVNTLIESQNKVRLGELLVDSNVVSSSDLTEAIQVSTRLNIPIGRVLLLSGLVSPVTLEAALEAQPLINEEKETKETVLAALKEVDTTGKPLEKMLPGSQNQSSSISSDKLAGLLLDSEIVSQDELDQALSTSFEEGVPLGSALVMEGILSPSLFPSILKIQQDIRDGVISKTDAVNQVKSTFVHWLKAEESLSSQGLKKTETEVSLPKESSVNTKPSSLEDTVEPGSVPISITFEPKQERSSLRVVDLLKESGRLTDSAIQTAFNSTMNDPEKSAQLLNLLGLIDADTQKNAVKCQNLLNRGQLSKQEAIYVLNSEIDQEVGEGEVRVKRYFDKTHRKSMLSKVVGGMAIGAAVYGLSIFKSKPK